MGTRMIVWAFVVGTACGQEPKPSELTPQERTELEAKAERLYAEGLKHFQTGKPAEALKLQLEELAIRRRLHGDEPNASLADILNAVGLLLNATGQSQQALSYFRQSLEMRQKLFPATKYPDGHPQLANGLNNLGFVTHFMGRAEQALSYYRQSLEMRQKLFPASEYPDGHPDLAISLNGMGNVLDSMGQSEQAMPYFRQSLEMYQKLFPAAKYPDGHPSLATSLNGMGFVLNSMGRAEQALPYLRQSLEMTQKLYPAANYPDGHPQLAVSLNNLGVVLESMGQAEQALPFYQQSLEMNRKLFPAAKYPDGHPDLATSLNNLGFVFQTMGQAEQALPYYRQSLEMRQKLFPATKYPDGHPDLATSLNNLGFVLQTMGRSEQALPYVRQSLEMNRKLYPVAKCPDGHPQLAISLNNLGVVLESMGRAEQALPYVRQSLEMTQKLFPVAKYPDGHPLLAISLGGMGLVLKAMGQAEQALPFYRQSLEMQQRLLRRELATASEEAAFGKVNAQPLFRDAYLSVTYTLKTGGDDSFACIWPSRSMVTRLLDQRQANARAAGTELGDQLDKLRGLRRRLDQLLQDTNRKPADRDNLLVRVAEERDRLEREVVDKIPTLKRWQELDQLGPADLVKALPPGTVFVDVIRYTHIAYVEKKQKHTPSYVAFVLAKDRPIQRVELGKAKEIDPVVRAWRLAIEAREASPDAGRLSRSVWEPLAKHIPPGTTTVYLAADGDLARLPWAALPIAKDRVLLEEYALAQVPHGTWLLDQLRTPPPSRAGFAEGSLLTLGGVDYGPGVWPSLPGTAAEAKAIAALASSQPIALAGKDATVARLTQALPTARYAHLATHGEFKADALTQEKQRAAKAAESRLIGDDSRKVAAKNPLGYVGLVLANGDVLSGLSIVDLKLDNLKLVTLSACETGLGELTGGEGVQGLQRAFHLAGCPNVVASLWKVNDAATAALMAKFYHELWVNKKPPIEAPREAQLTIYRRPDLIPELAGEHGAPKLKEAVSAKIGEPSRVGAGSRSDTKLWAAFVLSGVGK